MGRRLNTDNIGRFKEECANSHKRINPNEDVNALKDKVDIMEKMVKELNMKIEIHNLQQM